MHQPCHVGDNHDKGGNQTQVRFYTRGSNMHRVWDTDMIERAGDSEDFWLADLARAGHRSEPRGVGCEERSRIGRPSLLAAREAYQVPETGKRLKPGQKLGDAYLEANMPVVRRRLYQGA